MVHILQNAFWRVGILPETGASIAFGQFLLEGEWQDIFRPTPPNQYHNPSATSSFLMLPWANRILDGHFTFENKPYQLQITKDDGTARHGDVRKRAWQVIRATEQQVVCELYSADFADFNFPFAFRAEMTFELAEHRFEIAVIIQNLSDSNMPCGFGHHPYFVRPSSDNAPFLQTPCDQYYVLSSTFMPDSAPIAITPELDFRTLRRVDGDNFNHLLTHLDSHQATRIVYPQWQRELRLIVDESFAHMLIFTPSGEASLAVEPMTIATNGFNLHTQGIENGVWVLAPQATKSGTVVFEIHTTGE
jgi:aldose 1-epimerase